MLLKNFLKITIIFFITFSFVSPSFSDGHASDMEDLKASIKKMEAKIKSIEETNDALASSLEGSGEQGWYNKTSLGGYGELHWENHSQAKKVDAHRYVLFIGHEFNEYLNFVSEFELEHAIAGEGKGGEVELEQMYLEQNLSYLGQKDTFVKYGIFLIPVGIINETHEPPTFYGVERNEVEKELGANTWWEAGTLIQKGMGNDLDITFAIHSGLSSTNGDIRKGRQKVGEADASNLAGSLRLRYTGLAGVEMALWSNYQGDLNQTAATGNIQATLIGGHINMSPSEGFGFRAVAGKWTLDCPDTHACYSNGFAEQWGAYVEPSYRISLGGAMDSSVGFFTRIGSRNDKADGSANYKGTANKISQIDVGMNYWLSPYAVLKVDYEVQSGTSVGAKESQGFNFGMGYQF